MKRRLRVTLEFEWRDLWVGAYVFISPMRDVHIYICLLPCLPLHFIYQSRLGTSALRKAYRPWLIKRGLENVLKERSER